MSKNFESIRKGLNEAIAHGRRKRIGAKVYKPRTVDVAGLRARLGLTQEQFSARFGFSVSTLRRWERGDRAPSGAALVFLNLIDRDTRAVMRALS